jgi:putative membrane protein insertion efficiency factor
LTPVGSALALLVRGYQLVLRPLLPPSCRFTPSCSAYAIEALRSHGAIRGLWLASWRVVRCNPFCAAGYDPVPPHHAGCPHGGSPANLEAP